MSGDIGAEIKRYLELYRTQEPAQAHLLISQRTQDLLDALDPTARQSILDEIDGMASSFGLRTPTTIEVWKK